MESATTLAYALTSHASIRAAWGLDHVTGSGIHRRAEAYDKQLTDRRPSYRNWRDDIEIFPELAGDRIRLDLAGGMPAASNSTPEARLRHAFRVGPAMP